MKHYVLEIIKENKYLSRENKEFWINSVYNLATRPRGLDFCTDTELRKRLELHPMQSFTEIPKDILFKAWVCRNMWQTSNATDNQYHAVIRALEKARNAKRSKLFRLTVISLILLLLVIYFIFQ